MTDTVTRRSVMAIGAAAAMTDPRSLRAQPVTNPLRAGIQEVVVSVFDFDHLARPLIATGDFTAVPLPDAPREQWTSWQVPTACTRIEQLLLRHNGSIEGAGALKLVKFHGVEQKVMRSSQRSWDTGGIFDVDVTSKDANAIYRLLQRHGWTAQGEPVEYTENGLHVWQVVAEGPNGFQFAVIQKISPPLVAPPFKMVSPITNSTQMVADLDRALDFYTRVLGFKLRMRFDITNQAEPGADVIGLPLPQAETAVRRLAMLDSPNSPTPAHVELIENKSMHGRRFDDQCIAPNVGILCLRIPVANAADYAAAIVKRGGKLFSPPQALTIAPYGKVTLFNVRSPEGAMLEFYSDA